MSQSNSTDVVRRYFDAVARGDMPTLASLFCPDVVWHQPGGSPLSGTYQGTDKVFALLGQFMERSEGTFRIDSIGPLMSQGDLVATTLHFRAERSGQSMSMGGIDVLRVENGQI